MVTIKKNFNRIIIESNSQFVVNTIQPIFGNISVPRDIVNLVEDIRNICPNLKEVSIVYSVR